MTARPRSRVAALVEIYHGRLEHRNPLQAPHKSSYAIDQQMLHRGIRFELCVEFSSKASELSRLLVSDD
jgi:hypothetical protein